MAGKSRIAFPQFVRYNFVSVIYEEVMWSQWGVIEEVRGVDEEVDEEL